MQLKDISGSVIAFYICKFNSIDLQGDEFLKNSIKYNPRDLKHFLNHNPTQLIGVIQSIEQDDFGYFAVSELLPTTLGKDIEVMYEKNAINQHSIGGYIVDSKIEKNVNKIKEFELFEVSSLTHWGAQPDTPVKKSLMIDNDKLWNIYLNNKFNFYPK